MEFTATGLRLMAHILSFGLAMAVIGALIAARGKSFDMRYWKLLCTVLGAYAVWFFMLGLSLQDAALIRRGEVAWLFGLIELGACLAGWAWWGLTVKASFRLVRQGAAPTNGSGRAYALDDIDTQGDAWLQAQVRHW